jgi:hypothetical protein
MRALAQQVLGQPCVNQHLSVGFLLSASAQLGRSPLLQAFALGMEELQLQAWGPTAADMYACGLDIMDIDSRVGPLGSTAGTCLPGCTGRAQQRQQEHLGGGLQGQAAAVWGAP